MSERPKDRSRERLARRAEERRQRKRRRQRRRRLIIVACAALLIGGVAAGGYLYEKHRTGSIYHPHARFIAQPTPTLPQQKPPEGFDWPNYGYTLNHTRYFPAPESIRPPFKRMWVRNAHALLEFPPVIRGETIYQLADDGVLHALNKHTGNLVWERTLGSHSASTPAVTTNTVYATVLDGGNASMPGRIVALNSANGQIRWSKLLPSRTESSPLLDEGRVFFGSEDGIVYALNDRNGDVAWTYHAPGAVKASPTLSNGELYFGDYSGHVQAISEHTGKRIWISSSEGAVFGSGTFYSTAAVVYGRMFLGNTDGRIYAYDANTGKLDWAVQTGAYVYSSPAVTNAPGIGPTIYIGSYDGNFYALNARTGSITWSFDAHGRISGSPTIVGRIVYFADLAYHHIFGLGISTGRVLFQMDSGSFDPAVSDGNDLYLTGYSALYALEPTASTDSKPSSSSADSSSAVALAAVKRLP